MLQRIYNKLTNIFKEKPDKKGMYKSVYLKKVINETFLPNRCVFIHVPKTAGISVCTALFGIASIGHYKFSDYSKYLNKRSTTTLFKFTFVRNPYNRIFSAYSYLMKGGRNNKFDLIYQKKLQEFENFEDFVLNYISKNNPDDMDHFTPQTDYLSYKGKIIFDFLGKMETIDKDFEYVCQRLGKTNCKLPHQNKSADESEQINIDKIYSPTMKQVMAKIYKQDFDNFGYDPLI